MNKPIRNLFLVTLLLFGLLVAFTSRWTVFESEDLRANAKNRRDLQRNQRIKRGTVTAADGSVLARSVAIKDRDRGRSSYKREYPLGSLFSSVIGYSDIARGQAALEKAEDKRLTGQTITLNNAVDKLISDTKVGDSLQTTLVPKIQAAARDGLGDRKGSVVVLDPRSFKVLAMVSSPSYDPGKAINDYDYFQKLQTGDGSAGPLFNRATQGAYLPGSTFKLLTAAAALDSGRGGVNDTFDGANNQKFSGVQLSNFGQKNYGKITLRQALTGSVNTAFANVAKRVGRARMKRYMDGFGFAQSPELKGFPQDEMRQSGLFDSSSNKFISAADDRVDLARLAIGQSFLQVTPLQMASLTSVIANGGTLMKPRLINRYVDSGGHVSRADNEFVRRVISTETASQLRSMMTDVVNDGSGTGAALAGVQVAGKTGTAEIDKAKGINDLWFVGMAPVSQPRFVVAVVVEHAVGQGGTVAAPIARSVLQAALQSGASR